MFYYEASAKTGNNISDVFEKITREMNNIYNIEQSKLQSKSKASQIS